MKILGNLFVTFLSIAALGLVFKMTLVPGGGLLLVLSLTFASLCSLIQFVIGFVVIKNNSVLKIFNSFMSFTLFLCFIGVLFRYQWWPGWTIYYLVGSPLFILLTIAFIFGYKEINTPDNKVYFVKNIILPWCFTFFVGILPIIMTNNFFYNTFSYRRQEMTYPQFLEFTKAERDSIENK